MYSENRRFLTLSSRYICTAKLLSTFIMYPLWGATSGPLVAGHRGRGGIADFRAARATQSRRGDRLTASRVLAILGFVRAGCSRSYSRSGVPIALAEADARDGGSCS